MGMWNSSQREQNAIVVRRAYSGLVVTALREEPDFPARRAVFAAGYVRPRRICRCLNMRFAGLGHASPDQGHRAVSTRAQIVLVRPQLSPGAVDKMGKPTNRLNVRKTMKSDRDQRAEVAEVVGTAITVVEPATVLTLGEGVRCFAKQIRQFILRDLSASRVALMTSAPLIALSLLVLAGYDVVGRSEAALAALIRLVILAYLLLLGFFVVVGARRWKMVRDLVFATVLLAFGSRMLGCDSHSPSVAEAAAQRDR
jgi:hypothetical protein